MNVWMNGCMNVWEVIYNLNLIHTIILCFDVEIENINISLPFSVDYNTG
jgi:hypothetical protein